MTLGCKNTRCHQQRVARKEEADKHAGFSKDNQGNYQQAAGLDDALDVKHAS